MASRWSIPILLLTALLSAQQEAGAQQSTYSTKPFQVPASYDEKIPAGYAGHSLKTIIDTDASQIMSFKGRGEYETQEHFNERVLAFAHQAIFGQIHRDSMVAFVLPKVTSRYDMDTQMLFVRIGCTAYAYKDSELDSQNVALTLFSGVTSSRKTGKTRMGVPIHYVESSGKDYSIVLPRSQDVVPSQNIVIGIRMLPEESKRIQADLKVLMVGKIDNIYMGAERHTASFDEPYEDFIVHSNLVLDEFQLLVFNAKTGRIYKPEIEPF